jgi:tRNA-modifying protein YgfZ
MVLALNAKQHDALMHAFLHARREDIAVLKASGDKVRDYLQGQITQDMRLLAPARAVFAMVLTPQGKAVSDLILAEGADDELILLTWRHHAEGLVARLRQFSIGYALRLGIVADMAVHSIQGAHAADSLAAAALPDPGPEPMHSAFSEGGILVLTMPEAAHRGYWLVAPRALLDALPLDVEQAVDESVIRCARIRQGHPVFGIDWDESLHPLNANLHEYHGVSFDKGCYVGQEVTSRMHWRGGIKHHLYRLRLSALPQTLPAAIHTTVAIGSVTSAMQDSDGCVYGIGRLPISVAESGAALHTEDGIDIEMLEACHA